jgi:UDP-N-acetyl-D-mannosaminuronate dehydrogenase
MKRGKPLVVGLGEVGGALATVLEANGAVLRLDIERVDIPRPVGVMHICFPFQQKQGFVTEVAAHIKRLEPLLTIINSTVLPGTTRTIAQLTGAPVAYSPIRGKHAKMVQDLLHYKKFVASSDDAIAAQAAEHFRSLGMQTETVARPETLELAKLAETSYFGLQIAFAQELKRYADRVGGEYGEAIKFFEEVDFLPRTPYFPGFIGGHCVIPNINLLQEIAPCPLLESILDSNDRLGLELQASDSVSARDGGCSSAEPNSQDK